MEGIVSKIKTKNKRAFTLTELLIVVIVIGVLSAVTLPKFNRVIENRDRKPQSNRGGRNDVRGSDGTGKTVYVGPELYDELFSVV